MTTGNINVTAENIFPIIKKFLYSDHEIFLRELISNATDATLKLKHLVAMGEAKVEYGSPKIEVVINKADKTIRIIDQGLGMSEEEVEKYINQVAFSGAEEFVQKYQDQLPDSGIIGHFGLGFYSAFMVAEQVEIITKSYTDAPAVHWVCDGSPKYQIELAEKTERGTEIILHIAEDSTEFLEEHRIRELLLKYNKFMPVPIKFGTREETTTEGEGDDAKETKQTVDNIINNPEPAWTKKPSDLTDEDYSEFYRELYSMQFDEPIFNIHLNVDYPFNLTGILYFPKLSNTMEVPKDKIQLYQNQVFITDNVQGIVPDFLTMLRGVIDSPDIPLNVSRSYLQADGAVKKISGYITKKVGDKLKSLFVENRKDFEQKWDKIKPIIEYGMLTEEKFFDKAQEFALYPTTEGQYYTFQELIDQTKDTQIDKEEQHIILYASQPQEQYSYIETAKKRGHQVVILDSPLAAHYINKLEGKHSKTRWARVDSDHIDNIIKKDEARVGVLSEKEKESLKSLIEKQASNIPVQIEDLPSTDAPFTLVMPEFMRRMKDMQAVGGGGFMGMDNLPDSYQLVVNANHPLCSTILNLGDKASPTIDYAIQLAKLPLNQLKGEALNAFIQKSLDHLSVQTI